MVIISSAMFDRGTHELYQHLNYAGPPLDYQNTKPVNVKRGTGACVGNVRNFVYENFNPSHLPENNDLRNEIFSNIASPETDDAVPVAGCSTATISRAELVLKAGPGTAAEAMVAAIVGHPWRSVDRCAPIILV